MTQLLGLVALSHSKFLKSPDCQIFPDILLLFWSWFPHYFPYRLSRTFILKPFFLCPSFSVDDLSSHIPGKKQASRHETTDSLALFPPPVEGTLPSALSPSLIGSRQPFPLTSGRMLFFSYLQNLTNRLTPSTQYFTGQGEFTTFY